MSSRNRLRENDNSFQLATYRFYLCSRVSAADRSVTINRFKVFKSWIDWLWISRRQYSSMSKSRTTPYES